MMRTTRQTTTDLMIVKGISIFSRVVVQVCPQAHCDIFLFHMLLFCFEQVFDGLFRTLSTYHRYSTEMSLYNGCCSAYCFVQTICCSNVLFVIKTIY